MSRIVTLSRTNIAIRPLSFLTLEGGVSPSHFDFNVCFGTGNSVFLNHPFFPNIKIRAVRRGIAVCGVFLAPRWAYLRNIATDIQHTRPSTHILRCVLEGKLRFYNASCFTWGIFLPFVTQVVPRPLFCSGGSFGRPFHLLHPSRRRFRIRDGRLCGMAISNCLFPIRIY